MSEKDLIIIESVADGIIKSKEVEKKIKSPLFLFQKNEPTIYKVTITYKLSALRLSVWL